MYLLHCYIQSEPFFLLHYCAYRCLSTCQPRFAYCGVQTVLEQHIPVGYEDTNFRCKISMGLHDTLAIFNLCAFSPYVHPPQSVIHAWFICLPPYSSDH